jgi:hypothetical protein
VGEREGGEERSGENASADARNVKMRTRWPCCISLLARNVTTEIETSSLIEKSLFPPMKRFEFMM